MQYSDENIVDDSNRLNTAKEIINELEVIETEAFWNKKKLKY